MKTLQLRCTKCDVTKDVSEFHLDRRSATGVKSACKECVSKQAKERAKKIKAGGKYTPKSSKICPRCGETKNVSEFYRNVTRIDGLSCECKECGRKESINRYHNNNGYEKQLTRYEQNHDKYKSIKKKYRDSEKGREATKKYRESQHYLNERKEYDNRYNTSPKGKAARARVKSKRRQTDKSIQNTLTAKEWDEIIEKQNNKCAICKVEFSDSTKPTRDHIVPLSWGIVGLTKDNTQALCQNCNSRKGNRWVG